MKTLSLASICLLLTLSMSANGAVQGDLSDLMKVLDEGLCAYEDGVGADLEDLTLGCDPEFSGWFGDSTDTFKNVGKKKGKKKRNDAGCEDPIMPPAEASSCDETGSKAEWRHDSLRAGLESTYRDFDKDKFYSANFYICRFIDDVNNMVDAYAIDYFGAQTLLEDSVEDGGVVLIVGAETIADSMGAVCLDE